MYSSFTAQPMEVADCCRGSVLRAVHGPAEQDSARVLEASLRGDGLPHAPAHSQTRLDLSSARSGLPRNLPNACTLQTPPHGYPATNPPPPKAAPWCGRLLQLPDCCSLLSDRRPQAPAQQSAPIPATPESPATACSSNPLPAPPTPSAPANSWCTPYSPDRPSPPGSTDPSTQTTAATRRVAATSTAGTFHPSPDAQQRSPSNPPRESSARPAFRPAPAAARPHPPAGSSETIPRPAASLRHKTASAVATPIPAAPAPGREPARNRSPSSHPPYFRRTPRETVPSKIAPPARSNPADDESCPEAPAPAPAEKIPPPTAVPAPHPPEKPPPAPPPGSPARQNPKPVGPRKSAESRTHTSPPACCSARCNVPAPAPANRPHSDGSARLPAVHAAPASDRPCFHSALRNTRRPQTPRSIHPETAPATPAAHPRLPPSKTPMASTMSGQT